MASIKDYFERALGSSAGTTRVTHGTTYQRWTFGCCSACCQCIPTTTDYYVYEMWGQGGGGGSADCCQGGIEGGSGGGYGAVRVSYLQCSSNRQMCFCACMCYCCACCQNCGGGCGQFSRMCLCGLGHCAMVGGGCISGASECFYVITDNQCNNCFKEYDLCQYSGGGGGSGELFQNTQQCGNVCHFDPNPSVTQAGGSTSGDPLDYFNISPCTCGPWNGNGHCAYLVESEDRDGSRGWACGTRCAQCPRGAGGGAWAGGQMGLCWGTDSYARSGCYGVAPGGGAATAGACSGPCCWGGIGGPALIITSIDT